MRTEVHSCERIFEEAEHENFHPTTHLDFANGGYEEKDIYYFKSEISKTCHNSGARDTISGIEAAFPSAKGCKDGDIYWVILASIHLNSNERTRAATIIFSSNTPEMKEAQNAR